MDVQVPRGKPKSGRVWRDVRTDRHSAIKKDKGLKVGFAKRVAAKKEINRVRLIEHDLKQSRSERKQEKRLKEEEKRQRKVENERRSEIVVPLKNPAKIKKMKRSQLRLIEKR